MRRSRAQSLVLILIMVILLPGYEALAFQIQLIPQSERRNSGGPARKLFSLARP